MRTKDFLTIFIKYLRESKKDKILNRDFLWEINLFEVFFEIIYVKEHILRRLKSF